MKVKKRKNHNFEFDPKNPTGLIFKGWVFVNPQTFNGAHSKLTLPDYIALNHAPLLKDDPFLLTINEPKEISFDDFI